MIDLPVATSSDQNAGRMDEEAERRNVLICMRMCAVTGTIVCNKCEIAFRCQNAGEKTPF